MNINFIGKLICSVSLPILFNLLYNLSELRFYGYKYYPYIFIIDLFVIVGVIGTFIVQFYGTYLILGKIKGD